MAKPNLRSKNGHRRRELIARVRARDTHCALCGGWIDPTLTTIPGRHGPRCRREDCPGCVPHPLRGEVDEDVPVSRGGSPTSLDNCHLMHRACNQWKSDRTLAEARLALVERRAGNAPARQQPTITTTRNWRGD